MPTSGPERLGPDPRPPDQQFWDPEMQTMSRDERRSLQDERWRTEQEEGARESARKVYGPPPGSYP